MSSSSQRALLLAATIAAYLGAIATPFQFDDFNVIVGNPAVQEWAAFAADWPHVIRPLTRLSWLADWNLGWGSRGFHLTSLALHAASVLLVHALSLRALALMAPQMDADARRAAGFAAALLFALHPVHTEAVTYLSGRSVLLAAALMLGGLLAYDEGVERRRRGLVYGAAPLLFLLACAARETALVFPLVLLLWEALRRRAGGPWREALPRLAWHGALAAAGVLAVLWHPRYEGLLAVSAQVRGTADNLLTQLNALYWLLGRLPRITGFNIDPHLPVLAHWSALAAAQAAALALAVMLALARWRSAPWLGFALFWLLVCLLPTNSLVPRLDVANERQLYPAAWGIFLAAGLGWQRLAQAAPRAAPAVLAAAALALAWGTWQRNGEYASEIALWEATVRLSPDKPRPRNNLGYAYLLAGRREEARREFRMALSLDPAYARAAANLADLGPAPGPDAAAEPLTGSTGLAESTAFSQPAPTHR